LYGVCTTASSGIPVSQKLYSIERTKELHISIHSDQNAVVIVAIVLKTLRSYRYEPEVGFEEIATDFREARFWIVTEATINNMK
jgi:hypothetical protein